MEDEDDDMAALSQDPGYLEWMEKQRQEWIGEQIQEEHSKSLEYPPEWPDALKYHLAANWKQEFEEEIRRGEAYYSELEDEENG